MSLFTLLLVALALGTDAFALAIGIGITGIRKKRILIVSLVVCLFHIFMPLIGLGIGLVVLILIGLNMLWGVMRQRTKVYSFSQAKVQMNPARKRQKTVESFWGLIMLAGSVSIDALSVGFGLGALRAQIWGTVAVLGVVAGFMTALGFLLGRGLGSWMGEKAETMGGIILVAVGIKLLF